MNKRYKIVKELPAIPVGTEIFYYESPKTRGGQPAIKDGWYFQRDPKISDQSNASNPDNRCFFDPQIFSDWVEELDNEQKSESDKNIHKILQKMDGMGFLRKQYLYTLIELAFLRGESWANTHHGEFPRGRERKIELDKTIDKLASDD